MASAIYNNYKVNVGTIDWNDNSTTTIKCMLIDSGYVVDIDNHLNKSDVDSLVVEVSGAGYVSGGSDVTTRAVSVDNVNDWAKFDADDMLWGTSTLVARGAIVYLDTGVASTSTLIAYVDFLTDKSSNAGDFIIQWHSDGIYRLG